MFNEIINAMNEFIELKNKKPDCVYLTYDEALELRNESYVGAGYCANGDYVDRVFGLEIIITEEKREQIVGIKTTEEAI